MSLLPKDPLDAMIEEYSNSVKKLDHILPPFGYCGYQENRLRLALGWFEKAARQGNADVARNLMREVDMTFITTYQPVAQAVLSKCQPSLDLMMPIYKKLKERETE